MGSGDPIYWYGIGDATMFPEGRMFMRVEGYDTGRLHELDADNCTATGLTRKMMVIRDPASGEIMQTPDGQPVWINNFTYQLFRFALRDGFLTYEVEHGIGDLLETVVDGYQRSEVQHFGDLSIFTTPVNYSVPGVAGPEPVWENYDFIASGSGDAARYTAVWAGAFPVPPFLGGGRSSMHGYFQRYDRYGDVPGSLRDFVEEHAELWTEPPRDIDEIRQLQSAS